MAVSVLGILVPVAACVVAAWLVSRMSRGRSVGPRRGNVLIMLGVGVLVGVALFVLGGAVFGPALGLVQMAAPGVGALVVLVGLIASPGTGGTASSSEAELAPRGWNRLGPAWLYGAPAGAVVVMVTAILFFGASGSPDDQGRQRIISVDSGFMAATASPYPGWYYGLPALALALVLLVATVVALARIARHPLRGTSQEREAAREWRAGLARVVMAVGTGSALLYTGAMSVMASSATSSVTEGTFSDETGKQFAWDLPVLDALAVLELGVGLCAIIIGLFLWASAIVTAARR
ncbi:hypothetical protein [Aestuariimicrobium sp. Y1814]|uniref:hypothetical protein n=1 Tax=Aestuariimicrobium sp. Y1814 TaxID=3418742 RepID=UPI003DA6F5E3